MSPTCSLSLIGKAPVSKTGRCGFESQQIVPSSYMRNRVVEKSTEACSSQMRLVFAERPNEFVGEVQHVDNKRIPINYHKRNTPMPTVCVPRCEKGWLLNVILLYVRVVELAYTSDLSSDALMD